MRNNHRKKPATTHRLGRTIRPESSKLKQTKGAKDAQSKKLQKLSAKLGNKELDGKLKTAGKRRDGLLAFIVERLQTIESVQSKELTEMSDVRDWFREVAKRTPGFTLMDPTRWHEAASLYKKAAETICNGNLGRGRDMIERAVEAEHAAFESLPKQVEPNLDPHEQTAAAEPAEMGHIPENGQCPRTAVPEEIDLANRILNVQQVQAEIPPQRLPPHTRMKMWWEEEEEEEEEQEGKGG